MSDGNKRAFTLIELLIVLSLIAILAALLFPVLSSARLKASETQCLSNMRQISLGVQLYSEDYEETYPLAMEIIAGTPSNVNYWAVKNYQTVLEPYIRTGRGVLNHQGVWFDPADPDKSSPSMWGSFLVNGFLSDMPRHTSDIAMPSSTIYSVIRRENWAKLNGVAAVFQNPPIDDPNHAFWQSNYFNMSLVLWSNPINGIDDPTKPFNWRNGKAESPCYINPPPLQPGSTDIYDSCDHWDKYISASRYGKRLMVVYADGHGGSRRLEQTYVTTDNNEWDIK